MGLPFKKADAALQEYATLLRDKVAPANLSVAERAGTGRGDHRSRRRPRQGSARCRISGSCSPCRRTRCRPSCSGSAGRSAAGGVVGAARAGRAGSGCGAARQLATRDRKFYQEWLAALRTLDFDRLSRNAQVDYLFIKKTAEQQIGAPRRDAAGQSAAQGRRQRDPGPARGPAGAHLRSAGRVDPVHAGGADRAGREGVRLVRGGDEEGLAARWVSATTGRRRSRG